MNTRLLKTARRLWAHDLAPQPIQRRNQREWARAVHRLGDRWLLAKPVERRA